VEAGEARGGGILVDAEAYYRAFYEAAFSLERESMQTLYFDWATHERLHFRFDDTHAAQGSHHQKFVVIDRSGVSVAVLVGTRT